jgi:hypothetical protein
MGIPNFMRILYNTYVLTEFRLSWSLWIADVLSHCTPIFFSHIWWMQKIWSVVDLLRRNPHLWSLILHLHMDLTLREGYWITFCMLLMAVISHDNYYTEFIVLHVNWYNNSLFLLIRQIFLILNRMNKFMDLIPSWISPTGIWSLPGDLYFFSFAIAISTSRRLGPGTNGSGLEAYF